jgi:transcriptional regulator with XRE-family HTH domain
LIEKESTQLAGYSLGMDLLGVTGEVPLRLPARQFPARRLAEKTRKTRVNIQSAYPAADEVAQTTADILTAIGERIRSARLAQGMTLQSLAAAANLSPSMLSLVERGRATPSIGSLVVIATCLGVAMSDLVAPGPLANPGVVVRAADQQIVETANHVIRRIIREDRGRGVSIAVNEYLPNTGNSEQPVAHDGYEYGFVLEGTLSVEVDGTPYVLNRGDLISYSSRKPHRLWNYSDDKVRTLWFNLQRD